MNLYTTEKFKSTSLRCFFFFPEWFRGNGLTSTEFVRANSLFGDIPKPLKRKKVSNVKIKRNKNELVHISQVPVYIGEKKMTLQQIQEKARKEKPSEEIRKN